MKIKTIKLPYSEVLKRKQKKLKKPVGERSRYLQKYIQLLYLIYDNKDYGIYNYNLYLSYLNCAKDYADIKDRSETLKYIDLAKRHLFNYELIIAYF